MGDDNTTWLALPKIELVQYKKKICCPTSKAPPPPTEDGSPRSSVSIHKDRRCQSQIAHKKGAQSYIFYSAKHGMWL